MSTYNVTASRGAGHLWFFRCREFPDALARAKSLSAGYDLMPAEIAFAAGVEASSVEIALVPDCPAVPLDEAQATLPALVAEAGCREVYLTHDHEAVAVLLSADQYERTLAHVKELEESLAAVRASLVVGESRPLAPVVYEA